MLTTSPKNNRLEQDTKRQCRRGVASDEIWYADNEIIQEVQLQQWEETKRQLAKYHVDN